MQSSPDFIVTLYWWTPAGAFTKGPSACWVKTVGRAVAVRETGISVGLGFGWKSSGAPRRMGPDAWPGPAPAPRMVSLVSSELYEKRAKVLRPRPGFVNALYDQTLLPDARLFMTVEPPAPVFFPV